MCNGKRNFRHEKKKTKTIKDKLCLIFKLIFLKFLFFRPPEGNLIKKITNDRGILSWLAKIAFSIPIARR